MVAQDTNSGTFSIFDVSPVVPMTKEEFRILSSFVEKELGIRMPPAKKIMLESRLYKRLRLHQFTSYGEYIDFVFSEEGKQKELPHMIDAVTTNKTDFFREADHFDVLLQNCLPELCENLRRPLRVWSAGCATGEEPYTIAIVMEEYRRSSPAFSYEIVASDISNRAIEQAIEGIYEAERIDFLPYEYKKRYFLKSKDPSQALVRVKKELREKVRFERLNLMEQRYPWKAYFDIVFCRNVIIYFERKVQEDILKKICETLVPGGFLFLGHSETITGFDLPLVALFPTVYQKR
ncbi:MAG TPA: CheR family methyltransferase [Termitinemataceae bacterium]|uniref:CheR family methyltransferase n=1 Tax=Treponema sp. J25 TaxID=2094121 RepID=UPI001FB76987|nr:CheR family methyltransferase [Treponema sp. J25]HOJ98727.1 CheR family methyltransferase [Termitinemataceae bacterium]HOM23450.1 CheR family methyltransferase [Termitinemataceae bacterium]HPQ00559.1 CheR family methyltransferase [Termitinemataceae bacterium]